MHDAAYKLLFSHRRMVEDLLRGFLPDGATMGFEFDTLEPLPASHVGRSLERREGDMIWRLRARAAPGAGWVFVMVLLEFQSRVDWRMALRVLTYTGLAWEGLLRRGKTRRSGPSPMETPPLPPVAPFVIYNGASPWTAPLDVSALVAQAAPPLARLQPRNQYVLLDMQRAQTGRVPKDNAVALQVALEQAMLEEAVPILTRVDAVLAGPEHVGLRKAFAAWLRRSWEKDYGVLAGANEALRGELDRMVNAGEVEAMGSLAVERWKARERRKEAQILARGRAEGRTEGLEFDRRLLRRLAARRFGDTTGDYLSAILADVSEQGRLTEVGEAIIECGTDTDLLAAARRIVGGDG